MDNLHQLIEAEIPRLRRYAWALCRDGSAADDLVQDCLARALAKIHLWQEGTDLRAWLFTILHNQHVNRIRRLVREGTALELSESEPSLTEAPRQDRRLELRDVDCALRQLPDEQRSVILLIGLEGMRYEDVADALAVPIGTVRSRLSRGRDALRRLIGAVADRRAEQIMAEASAERRQRSTASAAPVRPCPIPQHPGTRRPAAARSGPRLAGLRRRPAAPVA